jgi:hypothetical protein
MALEPDAVLTPMRMEALCSYESMTAEILACAAGDTFSMIAPVGRHWMRLRRDRDGSEGHLPVEFLAEMPAEPVSLVRAIADYEGSALEEVSFRSGDILTLVDPLTSGPCMVAFQGRMGLVPSDYLKEVSAPIVLRATASFVGDEPGFRIREDDRVTFLGEPHEGWVRVLCQTHAGLAPSSMFVETLPPDPAQMAALISSLPMAAPPTSLPPPPPSTGTIPLIVGRGKQKKKKKRKKKKRRKRRRRKEEEEEEEESEHALNIIFFFSSSWLLLRRFAKEIRFWCGVCATMCRGAPSFLGSRLEWYCRSSRSCPGRCASLLSTGAWRPCRRATCSW